MNEWMNELSVSLCIYAYPHRIYYTFDVDSSELLILSFSQQPTMSLWGCHIMAPLDSIFCCIYCLSKSQIHDIFFDVVSPLFGILPLFRFPCMWQFSALAGSQEHWTTTYKESEIKLYLKYYICRTAAAVSLLHTSPVSVALHSGY